MDSFDMMFDLNRDGKLDAAEEALKFEFLDDTDDRRVDYEDNDEWEDEL